MINLLQLTNRQTALLVFVLAFGLSVPLLVLVAVLL